MRKFRFSLLGLMIFTAVVALGFHWFRPISFAGPRDEAVKHGLLVTQPFELVAENSTLRFIAQRHLTKGFQAAGLLTCRIKPTSVCMEYKNPYRLPLTTSRQFAFVTDQGQVEYINSLICDLDKNGQPAAPFYMITSMNRLVTADFSPNAIVCSYYSFEDESNYELSKTIPEPIKEAIGIELERVSNENAKKETVVKF